MKLKQTLILAAVVLMLAAAAGNVIHRIRHADSPNTSFRESAKCDGASSEEERAALLAAMNRRSAVDKALDEAETQVEMNSASGGMLTAIDAFGHDALWYTLWPPKPPNVRWTRWTGL